MRVITIIISSVAPKSNAKRYPLHAGIMAYRKKAKTSMAAKGGSNIGGGAMSSNKRPSR